MSHLFSCRFLSGVGGHPLSVMLSIQFIKEPPNESNTPSSPPSTLAAFIRSTARCSLVDQSTVETLPCRLFRAFWFSKTCHRDRASWDVLIQQEWITAGLTLTRIKELDACLVPSYRNQEDRRGPLSQVLVPDHVHRRQRSV